MSLASGFPQSLSKAPYEKTKDVAAKYELDDIAEGGGSDVLNLHSPLSSGYTRNDQRSMHRMGKNQELRVSADFIVVMRISC